MDSDVYAVCNVAENAVGLGWREVGPDGLSRRLAKLAGLGGLSWDPMGCSVGSLGWAGWAPRLAGLQRGLQKSMKRTGPQFRASLSLSLSIYIYIYRDNPCTFLCVKNNHLTEIANKLFFTILCDGHAPT